MVFRLLEGMRFSLPWTAPYVDSPPTPFPEELPRTLLVEIEVRPI
jgi:hypothetical protein